MKKAEKILCFLIYIFPLFFLLKNSFINIIIILICIFGIFVHFKKIFEVKENKLIYYLFLCFFLYLISISFYSYIYNQEIISINKEHFFKSIFFFRFFLLTLIVALTIKKSYFKSKYFLICSSIGAFVLTADILINSFLKFNLSEGITNNKISYILGDELIGGTFLQRFSLFFLAALALFKNNYFNYKKKNFFNIFFISSLILFLIGIILSENRMPLVIYTTSIVILLIFKRQFRKYLIFCIASFLIISLIFLNYSPKLKSKYVSFIGNTQYMLLKGPELFYKGKLDVEYINFGSGHLIVFNSGIQLWKENKFFGHGIKSFRLKCTIDYQYKTCTTHPHNYFIEILTDTGLLGFLLFYLGVLLLLLNNLKTFIKDKKKHFNINDICLIIIFFEFFPLRSTGSFFSTYNAGFIFFMLAFLWNKKNIFKDNLEYKKK